MSSDEINQDEYAQDAQNKEMLLEIFYKTKGNIDDINAAIDKKLFGTQKRSITIFEKSEKDQLIVSMTPFLRVRILSISWASC